jgi:thermitase
MPFVTTLTLVALMALPISAQPQIPTGQAPTGQAPTGQAPTGQAPTGQAPTGQAGRPPSAPAGSVGDSQAPYVAGEVLVRFKPAISRLGAQNVLSAQGLQVAGAIPAIDVLKVTVEAGQEQETIDALNNDPSVLYAEPNYIAYVVDTNPNDYYYQNGYQWGLPKIKAPAAWDVTTGSSDVVIAVVDTGIDLEHPDFSCPGKLVSGKNIVSPGSSPDDDHGHGTHVAGIAAACTNNVTGVAGVAWGARLMPVKALTSNGSGSYEWVASGITYAADQGADVINLSLGGLGGSSTLANAVQYAHDRGAMVVAAAGNCGGGCSIGGSYYYNPIMYPGAYPSTIAVAATDSSDNWASFSEHHPYVDVAAPGVSIYSTLLDKGYGYLQGTSMAAPHVSGLAALVWSLGPGLTNDQVRDVIQSTAVDLGSPGKDDYFGHGRINAWQATDTLMDLPTSPDQISFLIDDDSGPFPSSATVRVTTSSAEPINWSATISPPVPWLEIVSPDSGSVSAASPDSFTLTVPARPATYGTYTTTVVVIGTSSSGGTAGQTTIEVRITYASDLYKNRFPLILKSYAN